MRRVAAPTTKQVHFFKRAAGRGTTRRQAVALARAEAESHARGWRAEWEGDPDGEVEAWGAVLRDEYGHVLAQKWQIKKGDRATKRVVEAWLALEALEGE
jgi:hypothetical protein